MALKGGTRFSVEFGDVFPNGAHFDEAVRQQRLELLNLVIDGVAVGLPIPSSVDLNLSPSGMLSLYMWMDRAEAIEPWLRRLGLPWEPV